MRNPESQRRPDELPDTPSNMPTVPRATPHFPDINYFAREDLVYRHNLESVDPRLFWQELAALAALFEQFLD
jgi:hypothetical protein